MNPSLTNLFYDWSSVNISFSKFIEESYLIPNKKIVYMTYDMLTKYVGHNQLGYNHFPPVYVYTNGARLRYSFEKTRSKLLMKLAYCPKNKKTNITVYISYIFGLYVDSKKDSFMYDMIFHLISMRSGSVDIIQNDHSYKFGLSHTYPAEQLVKSVCCYYSKNINLKRHLFCNVEVPIKLSTVIDQEMQQSLDPDYITYVIHKLVYGKMFSLFRMRPINMGIIPKLDFFYRIIIRYSDYLMRARYMMSKINTENTGSNIMYYSFHSIFYNISEMYATEWDNILQNLYSMQNLSTYIPYLISIFIGARLVDLVDDVTNIIAKYYLFLKFVTINDSHINLEHDYPHGVSTMNDKLFQYHKMYITGNHPF